MSNKTVRNKNKLAVYILHGLVDEKDIMSYCYFIIKYFKIKRHNIFVPKFTNQMHNPGSWIDQANTQLQRLLESYQDVIIIGLSLGSNLAISLATDASQRYHKNIKGLILIEPPIMFNRKIAFLLNFVQPIFKILGIKKVKKSCILYRRHYVANHNPYLLVKTAGEIRKLAHKTKRQIANIEAPLFIIQSQKSDLISIKSGRYIIDHAASNIKKIYIAPINNHDLNLLDEENKIIVLDKINSFIKKII